MLIKLHRVFSRDAKEVIEVIWVNLNFVVKIEPVRNSESKAKSYVTLQYGYSWNMHSILESPDEIISIVKNA